MDLPLNVDVHCVDGRCGRSTHIILNPTTEQVTHLVVREQWPSRTDGQITHLVLREGHLWGGKW